MRETAEESSLVYVQPESQSERNGTKGEWVLRAPYLDESSSLVSDTYDSWASPTSKYQHSFGTSPTTTTIDERRSEKSTQDVPNHLNDSTKRFHLSNSTLSQNSSLRKYRLSRSPLDSLQEEFKKYGNLDVNGDTELGQKKDLDEDEDPALDTLDWSFVKRQFELPAHPKVNDCPSLTTGSTISSRNSSTRSTKSCKWDGTEQPEKGMCPIPECGRVMRDLAAHLLTHQAERPEKCPLKTCEYYMKGFARTHDKVRHTLTHFKGSFVCNFCSTSGTVTDRTFQRCDIFLRHLVSVHGVEQVTPVRREELCRTGVMKQSQRSLGDQSVATCTLCSEPFDVQGFYEHLRGCVLRQVTRTYSPHQRDAETSSAEAKGSPRNDSAVTTVDDLSVVPEAFQCQNHDSSEIIPSPIAPPQGHTQLELQDPEIAELTASSRCLSLTSSREDCDAMKSSSEEETDWTDDIGSPDSASDADELRPMLSPVKRHLVDSIMIEFHKIFDNMLRAHNGGGSSNSGAGPGGVYHSSSGSSTYSSSSFISRKRSLSGGSTPPPNDNGDDPHKRRRPDPKLSSGKQPIPEIRFACPYYKRNPGRHQTFTSCRDPGFIAVARLKEHLYRRHLLPIQCHRCCSTFTNEPALREHQRDPRGCEVKEHLPLEGFDKDQERKLKSKKRSLVYMSEEDKWKVVYRILFPDDNESDMPSPYIEYHPCNNGQSREPTNVARFQEFSRLELPRLVRRTLEVAVEKEAQPLEDKLKERLVDIVRECQSQLVSMFQTTQPQTFDTSELTPALVPSAGMPTVHNTHGSHNQASDPNFQGFDSYALAVTASEFIPIPASQYPPHEHGQHKQEASDSPDSGYDSARATRPTVHLQQQPEAPQAPPPFQLHTSSFNPGYVQTQQGGFIQEHGFNDTHEFHDTLYVDLGGYYGLFETQNQRRDVGFVGAPDPIWAYSDPAAGSGGNMMGSGM